MKKIIKFVMIVIVVLSLHSCGTTQNLNSPAYTVEQAAASVSYQTFYDELSPYGRWVDYPGYGYVWSPTIANFRPYYDNGYWMNTNTGWSWNSNYNWGWAPFHYGRWFYETGYGWMWLPGYEWAPAWVSWRNNAEYYGWAPLAPGKRLGASADFNIPYDHWAFVRHGFLNDREFRNHCIDEHQNVNIYNSTTIINNINYTKNKTAFYKGPEYKEVERYSGQKINPVAIREHQQISQPVIDNERREMKVYKPVVRMQQLQEIVKPKQVVQYKDIPHDNGKRGSWALPEQHPSQIQNNGGKNSGGGNDKQR